MAIVAACAALLLCAGDAMAASRGKAFPWIQHGSWADIVDGKAVYDRAEFDRVYLTISSPETVAKKSHKDAKGTLTIEGGRYTFWDGEEITVSGGKAPREFVLASDSSMTVGERGLDYALTDVRGDEISFYGDADSGLRGKEVRWDFPGHPELSGKGKVPTWRTTSQQLKAYVPYVELVRDGGKVEEIQWRFVDPADPSKAVKMKDWTSVQVRAYDHAKEKMTVLEKGKSFKKGSTPQGTVRLDPPLPEEDLCYVQVRFWLDGDRYSWRFSPLSVDDGGIVDRGALGGPIVLKKGQTRQIKVEMADGFELTDRENKVRIEDASVLIGEASKSGDTVIVTLTGQEPGRTALSIVYYQEGEGNVHQRMSSPQEVIVEG